MKTSKDFGPIRDDYTFFEAHTTEFDEDLRAYLPHLAAFQNGTGPIQMLDFGCGPGTFSAKFLTRAGFAQHRLDLSLVEPVPAYLAQAMARVEPFTSHAISQWAELPPGTDGRFDLVLANHVLYYVPNLDTVLGQLLRGLAPGGVFLTSLAGRSSVLIQFWMNAFALIGEPLPHHIAEDIEAVLDHQRAKFKKREVHFELTFEDKEENRLKILRFLLADHFAKMPRQPLLDYFNPYASDGFVRIRTVQNQFSVRRSSAW